MDTVHIKKMISIDPGSSCTGIALWEDGKLIDASTIIPPHFLHWTVRAKIISTYIGQIIKYWKPDVVAAEKGIYRGKANEVLLSLLSMITLEALEYGLTIAEVNQSTLKAHMGSGRFEKLDVAQAVVDKLTTIKEKNIIKKVIKAEEWDKSDAAAVGIWYYETH